MRQEILTSGYQGEQIEDFVSKLVDARVELLIDVRFLPSSRKPGFSKRKLEQHLAGAGIDYVHLRELGMPDGLRGQRHLLSDNAPILDAYDELLPDRSEAVRIAAEMLRRKRGCLLCFEADPYQCHRSRLADHLVKIDARFETVHLVPQERQLNA